MPTKLRLDLDRLFVDSFDTAVRDAETGTVFGEDCTCPTNCTCPGCPTCDETCDGYTCLASCEETCDPSCQWTDCGCRTADWRCD
jgi:hypothetical protein